MDKPLSKPESNKPESKKPAGRFSAASRHLSFLLRHHPESGGLSLDEAGWAPVDDVLTALNTAGHHLDAGALQALVATNDKRRFELADGHIRAAQGHSVDVDLGLEPVDPPAVLYHGTVARFLASIRASGLLPGRRRHVHLSADRATAEVVGRRRGQPVVLKIDAAGMAAAGTPFFRSSNGVWLVDAVPADRISGPSDAPTG